MSIREKLSIILTVLFLILMLYTLVLIPNYRECRDEGKSVRRCLVYLVR